MVLYCFEVMSLRLSLNWALELKFHVIVLFGGVAFWFGRQVAKITFSHFVAIENWLLETNDMSCLVIDNQFLVYVIYIWFERCVVAIDLLSCFETTIEFLDHSLDFG